MWKALVSTKVVVFHKLMERSPASAVLFYRQLFCGHLRSAAVKDDNKNESPRMREFREKLRERTPIERLEELEEGKHPYQEKEPLEAFPNNTNPKTGEVGGPRGPEPTRYGDWERKGRVSDF